MTDVKIVLRGAAADKLRKLVTENAYASPEDAVADALATLEASSDPELDTWLRETIVSRARVLEADPGRGLTPDQVRERLFGKR